MIPDILLTLLKGILSRNNLSPVADFLVRGEINSSVRSSVFTICVAGASGTIYV